MDASQPDFSLFLMNSLQARDVDVLLRTSEMPHQQNIEESEEVVARCRYDLNGIAASNFTNRSPSLDIGNLTAEMYEPQRSIDLSFAPPPKRFYRTFWRSAAKRLLQYERLNSTQRVESDSKEFQLSSVMK